MSQTPLEQRVLPGDRLLLDATTLIAYLDGGEAVSSVAQRIVDDFVASGRNPAVVSAVTVMEILVRPMRHGPGPEYQHALDFLTRFPNLRVAPIDITVAQEAASLRAAFRFSAPDALVIATGVVCQVGHLVTNDRSWLTKLQSLAKRITVCHLANQTPRREA